MANSSDNTSEEDVKDFNLIRKLRCRSRRKELRIRAVSQALDTLVNLSYEQGRTITISRETWKRTIDSIEYFYPIEIALLISFPSVTSQYYYPNPEYILYRRRKALRLRAVQRYMNYLFVYYSERRLIERPTLEQKRKLVHRIEESLFQREPDLRFVPYPPAGEFPNQLGWQ